MSKRRTGFRCFWYFVFFGNLNARQLYFVFRLVNVTGNIPFFSTRAKQRKKRRGKKENNSPTFHPTSPTPSPKPTTSPALSCPSPNSQVTFELPIPPCFQKCTSEPQMPVARTWTRHSPAAGDGVGASAMFSSWAGLVLMAMLGRREEDIMRGVLGFDLLRW